MHKLKALLILMRPKQWYKNLLVFVPQFFAFEALDFYKYFKTIPAFVSLCLASSTTYILNDIVDLEKDRKHPEKRKRPLAAGVVSVREAFAAALLTACMSVAISTMINHLLLAVVLLYLFLSQLYSLFFKRYAIVDAIVLAVNYVLRTVAGVFVLKVRLSPWLIAGVFFVALLLVLGKRRSELMLLGKVARDVRETYTVYSSQVLDQLIAFTSATVVLTYTIYAIHAPVGDWRLIITLPLVYYAVARYIALVYSGSQVARKMEELYKDKPLLATLGIFLAMLFLLLYVIPRPLM